MSNEELRQLALAATPGPWENSDVDQHRVQCSGAGDEIVDTRYASEKPPAERKANALFIAAANPAAVLALLDENARLRGALEETCNALEAATAFHYANGGFPFKSSKQTLKQAHAALEVKP